MTMRALKVITAGGVFALLGACVSPPFDYAEDRCKGAHNQCQLSCTEIDDGAVRSACMQRCLTQEDRCYLTGDDSASSLAVDRAIGEARTRSEKEAAFERWRAQKDRERAEAAADKAAAEAAGEPLAPAAAETKAGGEKAKPTGEKAETPAPKDVDKEKEAGAAQS